MSATVWLAKHAKYKQNAQIKASACGNVTAPQPIASTATM